MKIDIQPTVQLRPHPKENCIPSEILAQSCLLPITDCLKRESVHPTLTQSISGSSKKICTWKLILILPASASTREKEAMLVMAKDWAAASQMSPSTNKWTTVREPK